VSPAAGDRHLQTAIDLFRVSVSFERDLAYIGEMLAQRFEIDL
jgi:hypothetical protein